MADNAPTPETIADRVFELGLQDADLSPVLHASEDVVNRFLDRLVVRVALSTAENISDADEAELEEVDFEQMARLESLYHQERHQHAKAVAANLADDTDLADDVVRLSRPETWLAAEDAFCCQRLFLMKVASGAYPPPLPSGFHRYVVDNLKVRWEAFSVFLAKPRSQPRLGYEFNSKIKPTVSTGANEDFAAAVRALPIDEDMKRRWLEN
jgi:hypothetical protein